MVLGSCGSVKDEGLANKSPFCLEINNEDIPHDWEDLLPVGSVDVIKDSFH